MVKLYAPFTNSQNLSVNLLWYWLVHHLNHTDLPYGCKLEVPLASFYAPFFINTGWVFRNRKRTLYMGVCFPVSSKMLVLGLCVFKAFRP